jgi:hypothetical protein
MAVEPPWIGHEKIEKNRRVAKFEPDVQAGRVSDIA